MSESLRAEVSNGPSIFATVPTYILRTYRAEIETQKGWVPAFVNKVTRATDGTVLLTCTSGGVTRNYPYPGTKLRPYVKERWQDKPADPPGWK